MDYSSMSKEELINTLIFLNGIIKAQEISKSIKADDIDTKYRIDSLEEYWKTILDSIPLVVFTNDSYKCRWINKECFKTAGYTQEEWINFSQEERSLLFDFSSCPDSIASYLEFTRQGKKPENNSIELEYKMKKKNGEWIWIYSTFSYIYDPIMKDFVAMGTALDITDRKKNELEIARLNTELEEALKRERMLADEKNTLMQKEIDDKNRELNKLAIYLTEKNNCLINLKKQASSLSKSSPKDLKKMAAGIIRSIDEKLNNEAVWDTFEIQFESANPYFMKNLIQLFPVLSIMELRVCSLLKLNLSSKAISTILNISSRTVDSHRLRIRKKMNLNEKEQLSIILNSI
jgi:PAS domain S-box-containing protein